MLSVCAFGHNFRQLSMLLQWVKGQLMIAILQSSCWISGIVVIGFELIRSNVTRRGCDRKIVLTHGEVERRLSMPTKSGTQERICWIISEGRVVKGSLGDNIGKSQQRVGLRRQEGVPYLATYIVIQLESHVLSFTRAQIYQQNLEQVQACKSKMCQKKTRYV